MEPQRLTVHGGRRPVKDWPFLSVPCFPGPRLFITRSREGAKPRSRHHWIIGSLEQWIGAMTRSHPGILFLRAFASSRVQFFSLTGDSTSSPLRVDGNDVEPQRLTVHGSCRPVKGGPFLSVPCFPGPSIFGTRRREDTKPRSRYRWIIGTIDRSNDTQSSGNSVSSRLRAFV